MKPSAPALALLLLSGTLPFAPLCANPAITPIAVTDDTAPDATGADIGQSFGSFYDATINTQGDVLFRAAMVSGAGITTSNDLGLWLNTNTGLFRFGQEGTTAPNTGGALFAAFVPGAALSNSGTAGFLATLRISGTVTTANNSGIFAGRTNSSLHLVARKGDFAPDENGDALGVTFAQFPSNPAVSDGSGRVTFPAVLKTGTTTYAKHNRNGIWTDASGTLCLAARNSVNGDFSVPTAPDTQDKRFSLISAPSLSENDTMVFSAALTPEPLGTLGRISSLNQWGIWSGPAATASTDLLLDPAAGDWTPTRQYWVFYPLPDINKWDDIAFLTRLFPGSLAQAATDMAIFSGPSSSRTLVAQKGTSAPGGGTFVNLGIPKLSDSGDVLVYGKLRVSGTITRANNIGLWVGTSADDLQLIARRGQQVPGPDGAAISSTLVFLDFANLSLNENGQVAFRATMSDPAVGLTSANGEAIFAQETGGDIVMVARRGDANTLISGKIIRSLTLIGGSGGSDGRPRGWTHNSTSGVGQLVFVATFTDSTSGVFLATVP